MSNKCELCEGYKSIYEFGGIKKDCPKCRPSFNEKTVVDLFGSLKPPVGRPKKNKVVEG